MKKIFGNIVKAMKMIFIVFLVFLGSLCFREQSIAPDWVVWALERWGIASEEMVLSLKDASFSFRRGLVLDELRVRNRQRQDVLGTVLSVEHLEIDILRHRVRIVGLNFPLLDEGGIGTGQSYDETATVELPQLPTFTLEMNRSTILGVSFARLVSEVSITPSGIAAEDLRLTWPDRDILMSLAGYCRIDLVGQRLDSQLVGTARQHHIRPLLVALGVDCALPYMDAFTEIPGPIPAELTIGANLANADFEMLLDLRPKYGRYNGVALGHAHGLLGFDIKMRAGITNSLFTVDLTDTVDAQGRNFGGRIQVGCTNDIFSVGYDTHSKIALDDILAVAEFPGLIDKSILNCLTPPSLAMRGCSWDDGCRLGFTAEIDQGTFLRLKLADVKSEFTVNDNTVKIVDVQATTEAGGKVEGSGELTFFDDKTNVQFIAKGQYSHGTLAELCNFLELPESDRSGIMDLTFDLSGMTGADFAKSLLGAVTVKIIDGHLAQLPIFAGLTQIMAQKIPGVSFLVDSSEARGDFKLENGVLTTDNLVVEGGLLSLLASGTYDMVHDKLDFRFKVRLLDTDNLVAKIVHPLTLPLTNYLLEFRLRGTLDAPDWKYVNLIDRIVE